MQRILIFAGLLAGGGLVLFQVTEGVLGTSGRAIGLASQFGEIEDGRIEGQEVLFDLPASQGADEPLKLSTSWITRRFELPMYRRTEDGRQTAEIEWILRFSSLTLTSAGELRLVEPELTVFRQPEWADPDEPPVVTIIRSDQGLIDKGMESGTFWEGVEMLSRDGKTESRMKTERIRCHFEERTARTEEAVEYVSGADLEQDRDLVVTGVGLDADLELHRLRIDSQGRVDLVQRGDRFGVPLPGMTRPAGEPGDTLHMECQEELLVERVEKAGDGGVERYRVTLNRLPRVRRGDSHLSAERVLYFWIASRPAPVDEEPDGPTPAGGPRRRYEIENLRAVEGVVIVDRKEDEESRAEGDLFIWKRLPDGSEETLLRYNPKLTFVGTGGFGPEASGPAATEAGPDDEPARPARTVVTSRGDMMFVRRAPLSADGETFELATFDDDVVVRHAELDDGGSSQPASEKVLQTERLEIEFEPGKSRRGQLVDLSDDPPPGEEEGAGPRVREVRASRDVRFTGAEGIAVGDEMVWTRQSPTESRLTLAGRQPRLTLTDLEDADYVDRGPEGARPAEEAEARAKERIHLRVVCRDRMVYTRRTRPEGAGDEVPDPDDLFEAFDTVHVEKIPVDADGRPKDDVPRSTLDAVERMSLTIAERPVEPGAEGAPERPAGDDPLGGGRMRVRRFEAVGEVVVVDPEGTARARRLVYDAERPEVEILDLIGEAVAWSADGFVEGEAIRYWREEDETGLPIKDEVVVQGDRGAPAVVWRAVEDLPEGTLLDPANPPADRHRIQADRTILYDRLRRRAVASGRAFCRVYAGEGDEDQMFSLKGRSSDEVAAEAARPAAERRTPWVFKAQEIEATFVEKAPEAGGPSPEEAGDRMGGLEIERLVGERDVHIYSFKKGLENREARGHGFEYVASEKRASLTAAADDANDRVQVWQGEDWIRGRRIDFQDGPDGGSAWSGQGGIVHFKPDGDGGRPADSRAPSGPVEIECRGPIRFDRGRDLVHFEKDVRVRQDHAEFQSQVLDATLDPKRKDIDRIVGTGQVLLTSEDRAGRGERFEWDVPGQRGVLTGTPQARVQVGGGNWVWGNRVVFELDRNRVVVDGNPVGRYTPRDR